MGTRVSIDPEQCIGSGECVRLVPDGFEIDEQQGTAVPRPGAATVEAALLVRAAQGCPTQAIRVLDEDGTVLYEPAF